jgi:4-amino-4-deoxy-L-arabinose transferase-like glycosyltransferase
MKIQKIIGTVLFLCGIAVLWHFTESRFGDFAGRAGAATGQSLVILLLFLAVTSQSTKRKIAPILVIGIVWFGSVSYDLFKQAIDDNAEMLELVDAFSSSKKILPPVEREYHAGIVVGFMRRYFSRVQEIQGGFANEFQNAGIANMLTPENLSNTEIAKQSLAKITTLEKIIPETESKILAAYNAIQKALELRIAEHQDNIAQAVYTGLLENKDSQITKTKKYYEIEKNILNTISDILSLVIASKPQVKNSELLFTDQKSIDTYDSLFERLSTLSKEEENLVNEQKQYLDKQRDRYHIKKD